MWFSIECKVWRDTRDPIFLFDLSSPVSAELPLPANILRNYTLEFEIRVEKAFMDLRECLREVIKDRDCCRELTDTIMEDIEEMSSVHESKFATLRVELDWRGRSRVAGLEGELAGLTQRFATLDHTWDKERVALEAGRAEASSKVDSLALELVQAKAYVHSTLSMEYRREGDKPSESQLAFRHLQTELAKKEKALRVATAKVGTLWVLLETKRYCQRPGL